MPHTQLHTQPPQQRHEHSHLSSQQQLLQHHHNHHHHHHLHYRHDPVTEIDSGNDSSNTASASNSDDDDDHDLSFPSPGFFEGAEKLFEVVFRADGEANAQCNDNNGRGGLRAVERAVWEGLLKRVNCEIVSSLSNEYMDSYVLSESSMFVYPRKFILKTCGTTTLLHAVEPFLAIARSCGLVEVENVFYSRKCFIEPARQILPHGDFNSEVAKLKTFFADGESFTLGPMNGDHWYLFAAGQACSMTPVPRSMPAEVVPDQTLEVLMHELDPKAMRHFYRNKAFVSTRTASRASGIMDLVPEAQVDDLVFDPCGYSANGVIDESYFTIHVTPQPECSFASFETNIPLENYTNLINKVVRVFCPRRFTVTLFASNSAICGPSNKGFDVKKIHGFHRTIHTVTHLNTHNVTYVHFVRA